MTGRTIFRKYSYLINLFELLFKMVPKPFLDIGWNFLNSSESKVALFYRYLYVKKYSRFCGENIYLGRNLTIKNMEKLSIGNNVSIHASTYIDAYGEVTIENNVSIANQTSIISFNHSWLDKNKPIKYNDIVINEIIIKDDVWIGNGCRILAGVTINSRSIVGAGAVVTQNIASNTIVGGVPAKVIKKYNKKYISKDVVDE